MGKYPGAYVDHDSKDWEYDFGPAESTGEIASPYINSVLDGITKEAFPEGRTAAQEQKQPSEA
jgi:hypothetical protein